MKSWRRMMSAGGGRSGQRTCGRHSAGYRPMAVTGRVFDAVSAAQAVQLDQLEPGWLVWYGQYSRRFFAICLTGLAVPARVEACSPHQLRQGMREAEASARVAVAS
ncbi:hypothetical protein [Sphaerisporangium fuscum]|uniref:hypothetical protein n=1 Tax=Sphaerisporangium fuscum TaxID=2835868 RepID=UPI001BDCE981|nr:hypothetical protein [Sphaerisporangium fuscum]